MEPEEAGDSLRTCDSLQCVSPWWMLQQKGGRIDAAGKKTAGCGGTRELGVKQWPATQDGRRASRFELGG